MAEGPVNLNWNNIMKNVNENPYEFFKEGGWSFLGGTGAASGSDAEDSSSSVSEFEADNDDDLSSSSVSNDSSFSGGSADSESGSGSGGEDESGDDWDALEEKAAKCMCYQIPVTS